MDGVFITTSVVVHIVTDKYHTRWALPGCGHSILDLHKATVKTHGLTRLLSGTGQPLPEAGHDKLPLRAAGRREGQVPGVDKIK